MKKIILIGPESTGKSTLSQELAAHFNCDYVEEFARGYIDRKETPYQQHELLTMAKGQLALEENVLSNKPYLFIDTDLIVIKIWSEHKYGSCDPWILEQITKQREEERFYLLCKPDIPWENDPQRESPNDRDKLFEIYKKELDHLNHNYYKVAGERRLDDSIKRISNLTS